MHNSNCCKPTNFHGLKFCCTSSKREISIPRKFPRLIRYPFYGMIPFTGPPHVARSIYTLGEQRCSREVIKTWLKQMYGLDQYRGAIKV